jgi:hypothetical protein
MSSGVRYVLIQRADNRDIEVDPNSGAAFRSEWEHRKAFGDNRPIEVIDVDGVQRDVRPRDVTEVKNCY